MSLFVWGVGGIANSIGVEIPYQFPRRNLPALIKAIPMYLLEYEESRATLATKLLEDHCSVN